VSLISVELPCVTITGMADSGTAEQRRDRGTARFETLASYPDVATNILYIGLAKR
jgi:hypothetical protein